MVKKYNTVEEFTKDYEENPEAFNMLVPVQTIQEISSIYRPVINVVEISTELRDKDIYREKNAEKEGDNTPMYSLTHKALLKLFTAANGQIVESTKIRSKVCEKCIDIVKATQKAPQCGSCPANANVACRVTIKVPEMSGGWRLVQATREIDFSNTGFMKEGQIRQTKAFAFEHAESKALSRCIRKAFSIKSAYAIEELEKPFVAAYPVLDAREDDVRRALIAGAVAGSNLLYGTGLRLSAGQQAALPEAPNNVYGSTGEILDEDYDAEPPEQHPWEEQKYYCSNPTCKVEIAKNVHDFSVEQFGTAACTKCQQQLKKGGTKQ